MPQPTISAGSARSQLWPNLANAWLLSLVAGLNQLVAGARYCCAQGGLFDRAINFDDRSSDDEVGGGFGHAIDFDQRPLDAPDTCGAMHAFDTYGLGLTFGRSGH